MKDHGVGTLQTQPSLKNNFITQPRLRQCQNIFSIEENKIFLKCIFNYKIKIYLYLLESQHEKVIYLELLTHLFHFVTSLVFILHTGVAISLIFNHIVPIN